jgi:hypothetical protein
MNEHQKRQILEWFRRMGPITCSVCSHTEFKFDSELTALPVWRGEPHPRLDFYDTVPVVMLICTHCASVRLFCAARMGLVSASSTRSAPSDYTSGE